MCGQESPGPGFVAGNPENGPKLKPILNHRERQFDSSGARIGVLCSYLTLGVGGLNFLEPRKSVLRLVSGYQ
jgi:hypothetical protein